LAPKRRTSCDPRSKLRYGRRSSFCSLSAHKSPSSSGPRWSGKGKPQGAIGPQRGTPHPNGAHWRSLLIRRKDRAPNRNVRTIRRLCVTGLVGSILLASQSPDAEPSRLRTASPPMAMVRRTELGWQPLYRPRDNLGKVHGEQAKLLRMSRRNM
jgi:hypothetical protein